MITPLILAKLALETIMGRFIPAICLLFLFAIGTLTAIGDVLRVPEDYPTIQQAADIAVQGDIIDLAPGVWNQRVWGLSGVTLRGRESADKTILDGSDEPWSLVVCYGDPVTIEDITFRNGSGSNVFGLIRGGAIYAEFTEVSINRCIFENNTLTIGEFDSDSMGGAICGYYTSLDIRDSRFAANSANKGGALYATYAEDITVQNCSFLDNQAWEGGGIHSVGTPLFLSDSLFNGNLAEWQGGGVFIMASGEETSPLPGNVSNSDFIRNAASRYGYGQGGGLAITGAHVMTVSQSSFQDNYGYTGAGILAGMLSESNPMPVSETLFCGNSFHDHAYDAIVDDGTNSFTQSCWCSTDIDNDGAVGIDDLLLLLGEWNGFYYPDIDANNDQVFDVNDILTVINDWGRACMDDA